MSKLDVRPVGRPGDLGWVVMAHGEIYAQEFGWDATMEALVARIVADFAADADPRRAGWIGELDGVRVGCVLCVPAEGRFSAEAASGSAEGRFSAEAAAREGTAQLRLLLVHPDARGHGLGGRLVDTCVEHARTAGYTRMRLWTNDVLEAARRIYLDRGFALLEEEPHHSFGKDLVGQVYDLPLSPTSTSTPEPAAGTTPPRPGCGAGG
jgi:GNAT superfamily N-acetyltransferase